MEGELWSVLYQNVQEEAALKPRQRQVQYSDAWLLLVLLWAVLHDRPICWACQSCHWPADQQYRDIPSPATMSRRMRTLSFRLLVAGFLRRLGESIRPQASVTWCRCVDSKPLPVGGFSKDPDAKRGYATGGVARGYKLFAVWGNAPLPDAWTLGPMNRSDSETAGRLVQEMFQNSNVGGYLLADALHDTNSLHACCNRYGFQLIAPRCRPDKGLGHRTHEPARLRSIELLEGPTRLPPGVSNGFGPTVYATRGEIERAYGNLCSFAGGLQPLPAWVRTPHRISLWVAAKIAINAARVIKNKRLAA